MIPFTSFYGMRMNPFGKELPSKDAFMTLDMEQMQGRLEHLKEHPGIGLCTALGLDVSYRKTVMFQRIQEYLYSMCTSKNVHCMVCLDEAQYLNSDILKDLKMLCNFCMDSKNCFSLILLGQPALMNIMMRQPNEALRQRIAVNYHFTGLSAGEAVNYINNRMELAGASPRIFDESAITTAYGSCNGSLRQLNLILTKALSIGAQNNKQNIDSDMVLAAVNDISLF